MTMKHFILFLISLCSFPLLMEASADNNTLLKELDRIISDKRIYHDIREKRIAEFKDSLIRTSDISKKYLICGLLFNEYLHYQADSSLYYVNKKHDYLKQMNNPELDDEVRINRAEVYGVMGMYNEALNELNMVDVHSITNEGLKGYYYRTMRAYYGWLADYSADIVAKKIYKEETEIYRDSISGYPTTELDESINAAERMIYMEHYMDAVNKLLPYVSDSVTVKSDAYLHYTLSQAYEAVGDTANMIRHLAQTAIIDIKMAEREYDSLQKLALIMYKKGNLNRAYLYLTCSMEDAIAANARLRFLEVTQIYPIIDNAYKVKEAKEQAFSRMLLISVSVLSFLLVIAIFYLYYWMKKLSVMRKNLYEANKQLVAVNKDLSQTGKIKEVYIAKYLDRCVIYLDKLEQYRRSLEKLAMASKTAELFKAIKSEEFLREERKLFYNEFDKSFLDLFPHFVNDFNNLLQDDARIFPKKDEQLTTELRIFALIRLGVTDANRIAHFLGYSLATVYNYRSKIRNKAKGDKEMFEQDVMNL